MTAVGAGSLPTGAIVHGLDGNLYRVIAPPCSEDAIHEIILRSAIEFKDENTEEDVLCDEKCDVCTNKSNNDGSDDSLEAAPCSDTLLSGKNSHHRLVQSFWKTCWTRRTRSFANCTLFGVTTCRVPIIGWSQWN